MFFHVLNKCTFQVLDYDHTPAPVWSWGWLLGPKSLGPFAKKAGEKAKIWRKRFRTWGPTFGTRLNSQLVRLAPVKTVLVCFGSISFYRFIHVYPSLSNSGSTQLSPMMTFCPAILCTVQPQEHPVAMLWIS